jgi:dTDP-4-amino-4,6-dideoxygalactose transaminase
MVNEHAPVPILDLAPELAEIGAQIDAAWRRVVASGHFILGPEVEAFEREVAAYLGRKHAVGVNSGTDALVLALRALGVGPGDEVVTSAFTFFATAECVSAVGAHPVFVDVDPESYNLRADLAVRALTSRTKAIIPVHLFGHAADMDALLEVSRTRGVPLVEDVAQAFGGSWRGQRLGSFGTVAAFSFFPSKNLGCLGDGGLVATDDDEIAESVRMLRAHGSKRKYFNELIGYNSRLDALQAAILRAKLPMLDEWNRGRRAAAARYSDLLREIAQVKVPAEKPGAYHVYHQYTVRMRGTDRDRVRAELAERDIATMVYYPKAVHQLPVYAGRGDCFPEAEAASREVLSLPMWPRITPAVQDRVASALRAAL